MPFVDPEPTDPVHEDDATNQGVSGTDPAEGSDDEPAKNPGSPTG